MDQEERKHIEAEAAIVASKVASEAATVAKKVAEQAAETARIVSDSMIGFGKDVGYISKDVAEIKDMLKTKYVTVESFDPIKRFVYGAIGLGLTSLGAAIMALVIKR